MSQARRIAFLISVLALAPVVSPQWSATPAASVEANEVTPVVGLDTNAPDDASLTLVEANWCDDICDEECDGECLDWRPVGCTCYWVCESGQEGSQICMGAIGVSICAN